jgi:hypothetical protein
MVFKLKLLYDVPIGGAHMSSAVDSLKPSDLTALRRKLERLLNTSLKADVPEPPRLVRANSAFALLAAVEKLESHPDVAKLLKE